jgi:hypothetical protein
MPDQEMPPGYYGDPDDPCLDADTAAAFCGCSHRTTIYNWEAEGKLIAEFFPNRKRSNHPYVKAYRRSALVPLRDARAEDRGDDSYHTAEGTRINLKRAALVIGVSVDCLRDLLQNWKFPGDRPAVEKRRPAKGGPEERTILEQDALRIKNAITVALRAAAAAKRAGFVNSWQLAKDLGIENDVDARHELIECQRCWVDAGLLEAREILSQVRVPTAAGPNKGEATPTRMRWTLVYKESRARALWGGDYITPGVKALKELVADGPRPSPEVMTAMARLGIAGTRLRRVAKKAGVRSRRARGIGSGLGARLFELARRRNPIRPAEALLPLFKNGRVAAKEGTRQARAQGLTEAEMYAGLDALGVKRRRGGAGPYYWELPPDEAQAGAPTAPADPAPAAGRFNETEQHIVDLVRLCKNPILGETIAKRLGLNFNSHLRSVLSGLVKRNVLSKAPEGGYLIPPRRQG